MSRIPEVLNDAVDYGFEGGGEYKTFVTDLENRFEERDGAWKYPKHEFSARFGALDEAGRDRFLDIFHACRGRLHSFLFKDYNDFEAAEQPLAVPTGTSDKVQLYRTYTFGAAYTIRPIFAFKEVTIYDDNGDPVDGTMDLFTGEFTPTGLWGDGPYTWDGEYYVWVRLDTDLNKLTINAWRNHDTSIDLIEDPMRITATNVPLSWAG